MMNSRDGDHVVFLIIECCLVYKIFFKWESA